MSQETAPTTPRTPAVARAAPLFAADFPERNVQKLLALLQAKYCLEDNGSLLTSAALDKIEISSLSAARLVAYLRFTTFEIEEWIAIQANA